MIPPSAGPTTTPIWPATLRSAIALCRTSPGTSSGVSARVAGEPMADIAPASTPTPRYGQIELVPLMVMTSSAPAMQMCIVPATIAITRRDARSASAPAGSASTSKRQELRETDETEVERILPQVVDLPPDRHDDHLRCEPVCERGSPEQSKCPQAERGR